MNNFNQKIKIRNKIITDNSPVYIIAEAGVNHNGKVELAKRLVDVAVEAGADAVKFQTFTTDRLIIKNTDKAKYQINNTDNKESQYDMLKKLELSLEDHKIIKSYCQEKDITFLSTPYDKKSADMLDELGVEAYKISSSDNTNIPFLDYLSKKSKPLILSTGMAYLSEIAEGIKILKNNDFKDLILLHCVSNYPVSIERANLKAINTLKNNFNTIVGYSDHTAGIGLAPYSIPLGANVIEKHFTLDKSLIGPDHKASLNPKELKETVKLIRKIEEAMGTGIKSPTLEEKDSKEKLQKSIVSKCEIYKNDKITKENIIFKRPGTGISPLYIQDVLGKKAKTNINKNTIIELNMLKEE